ncbi:MAG TPA: helix-turn-helix domain-containing protein [Candidatus Nanoarchaeia archaeon]|nr:helix-turn-helix domain-containing protein [Candidatus Nanoarchaeia archaeon]
MLSLSDNEFSVLSFLVRNFTERLTIRNMAQRLDFSAAGVFNILKKLEKQNIVKGEKLGTGLFYSINFENKIAVHLAEIVLLFSDEKISINSELFKQAKAAISDKKNLLLLVDQVTVLNLIIPNVNIILRSEEEFTDLLRRKDFESLQILKKGVVLFGEEKLADIIKNCAQRF